MRAWALQDAKNRFSELVDRAIKEGPQIITRRGKETAVIVSIEDYKSQTEPEGSLVSFLRDSPLVGVDLDLDRVDDFGRAIDL